MGKDYNFYFEVPINNAYMANKSSQVQTQIIMGSLKTL